MKYTEVYAQAKINLSLDVLGKRPDGYHEVRMIMQTLALHDIVTLEQRPSGIEVCTNSPWIPPNEGNIAYKAAQLLMETQGIRTGLRISIDKRIPVAAGLAGGSSNAAAVLKGLNEMLALGLSSDILMAIGKQIGADVPYCLQGGTVLAEGIGEVLTPLSSPGSVPVVLVKPRLGVSTAWVYQNLKLDAVKQRPDIDRLMGYLVQRDITALAQDMHNVLEEVTGPRYPVIGTIEKLLLEYGALGSMMSGSGPTVFGIFSENSTAQDAYDKLYAIGQYDCYLTCMSDLLHKQ